MKTRAVKQRIKGIATAHRTTTVWWFGAEIPPLSQIAKVFCGNAFVSVHMCPVSTPSLRSVGHRPQAHGTQAQIYLATSPYLNVVCNALATQNRKAARQDIRNKKEKPIPHVNYKSIL
jgi:hypothetical protein